MDIKEYDSKEFMEAIYSLIKNKLPDISIEEKFIDEIFPIEFKNSMKDLSINCHSGIRIYFKDYTYTEPISYNENDRVFYSIEIRWGVSTLSEITYPEINEIQKGLQLKPKECNFYIKVEGPKDIEYSFTPEAGTFKVQKLNQVEPEEKVDSVSLEEAIDACLDFVKV